ncbi:tripartite tricarboxylate transporter substrate binding protein [Pelagovum pacificum]|uniref:Tripartite tricarboxylate transporter substrate binding protein n=1 Tax=Pelagovum pacificum TaxID=2588711 RepID=A0A5C5GAL6_9RHOB|nr:tripartite tricarboxylate transporter substrate binding protein [Pelagovum pacificum]QQA41962.1 tripartite tricarboxylate transporter substrate binding protein [Pelagovum pacificum]TNY30597.1 tripartite tricarboxylate transporter substrate binding protein [Pelagovum pacificum]
MTLKTEATLIVHGPPGSAPPVMADALRRAQAEVLPEHPPLSLRPMGDDPGVDSMEFMATKTGQTDLISTCTPVFIQAPLLRGMELTHRDLTPIARLVADRFFLVVRTDSGWDDIGAFLDHIRANTTRTGGYFLGGINHLLSLAIADQTKADVEFIVTESEPAVWNAMIEGRIDWGVGVAAEILPHVEAGTMKVLAVFDENRRPAFPNTPTLAEAGVPVTFQLWRGLMAPGGLSEEAQADWHEHFATLRDSAAWRDYLTRNGQEDAWLPGEPFRDFLEAEWDWYERHLGLAGLLPNT